ncbi:MAG: HlyD family efflux transporter periplasmic adaptor subunit [Planctomycetales bacterium]|nr:HlyD family efflux transporter periplasmic adaptor subunit [Planctomycetales bacterium]
MSDSSSVNPQELEQTKRQIRSLVEEIAALSKKKVGADEYYPEFLNRVVEALAAIGGAVWLLGEGNQLKLAYQINLKRASLDEPGDHQARHARLLGQVIQSGEGALVPPHSGSGDDLEAANPTELLLVLAPLKADEKTEAIIEIFQRPTAQPATRRGYLRFLLQMCELASEWLNAQKLQELGHRETLLQQVDEFARNIHESLELKSTAYQIANEAQRLIGCDRVSVAVKHGRKCRVEAVSGQDTFDDRSNVVTFLGELATKVVATGEPLWYSGSTEHLSPQIEESVQDYVDESHSKTVAIIPLAHTEIDDGDLETAASEQAKDPTYIGALIVEQIEDLRPQAILAPRIDLVCTHTERALSNSLDYNNLFLMPLWRAIGHSKWIIQAKTLPKTILISAAILITIIALCVIPGNFDLEGRGAIQPKQRRDIFVQVDGEVIAIHKKHGDTVKKGDLLVELRNNDLEVQLTDVNGQLATTNQQKASALRMLHDKNIPHADRLRMAGEMQQYTQRIASLKQQADLLKEKKAQLQIHAPVDGQVVTWDIDRLLSSRPVQAGQVLMTIADPNGPWELEVYMPENRMGHIADARKEIDEHLEVNYVVATDPTTKCQGKLREIQARATMHSEHGHSVTIVADIDKNDFRDPRPGATATARFHCGRAPIGYVWLHELFEWFESKVLFRI